MRLLRLLPRFRAAYRSLADLEQRERWSRAEVETFQLDLSGLVLDMTNFATWIDSANERAPIAKRGHSKQKRNDLRIVGLGLVVSTDGGVPLVSHAYPGNKPDVTQFASMVQQLVGRFQAVLPDGSQRVGERLTLVYDAGQNSEDNYEVLDDTPLSFVGSLPPSDHPELLAVAKSRYKVVDAEAFPGLVAFETEKVVFGNKRRLVVCHSDGLHEKQTRGFSQTLAKVHRQLAGRAPGFPLDQLTIPSPGAQECLGRGHRRVDIDRYGHCAGSLLLRCLEPRRPWGALQISATVAFHPTARPRQSGGFYIAGVDFSE